VRISWAVGNEADPRLERAFRGVRGEAAVPAVVQGLSAYVTGNVEIRDSANGELVRTSEVAGTGRWVVASVEGRSVAVSRPRYAPADEPIVIDLGTGRVIGPLSGHVDTPVRDLVGAGGASVVSLTRDGIVRVVSLETGSVRLIDAGVGELFSATILPAHGRTVAVLGGEAVVLLDLDLGLVTGTVATGRVRALTNWADGTGLIGIQSRDDSVTVWDVESGRCVFAAEARTGPLTDDCMAAVFAEDGRRVLAVADGEVVHLYDVEAGEPLGPPLVGPTRDCSVAADGAGRLVTMSGTDETLAVWRVASALPRGHVPTSDLRCVAVTSDGRVLAGGSDGKISVWSLADGHFEGIRGTLPGRVNAVASSQNMVLAAGGYLHGIQDDLLHRWVGDGPDAPFPLGQGGETGQLAVVGNSVLSLGCCRDVLIHDLVTGERVGALGADSLTLGLAVGTPGAAVTRMLPTFQLWDIASVTEIETRLSSVVSWGAVVHAVVDEAAVFVEQDHRVVVRDFSAGSALYLDPDNSAEVTAVAARGEFVAVARADRSVAVFELRAGDLIGTLPLSQPASALAWTAAGELVVAARRGLVLATL
jgi:WD40 repeat protein